MSFPDRHLIKENVIRDTHYGTIVYTHILRSYYPGETLMYVSGDECGWLKNPWDNSRQSLHVWIEKREVAWFTSSKLTPGTGMTLRRRYSRSMKKV